MGSADLKFRLELGPTCARKTQSSAEDWVQQEFSRSGVLTEALVRHEVSKSRVWTKIGYYMGSANPKY